MKQRNAFFAAVFTRELNRWKQENKKSQEAFAARIGVEPNMISRYKQGSAHPAAATLDAICAVLGVEKAGFYPRTFEEKLKYDKAFLLGVQDSLRQMEAEYLEEFQINPHFWDYLWTAVPELPSMLPSAIRESREDFLFQKNVKDVPVLLDSEDMAFLHSIQKDVCGYLRTQILKAALSLRLDTSSGDTAGLEEVLRIMASELLAGGQGGKAE